MKFPLISALTAFTVLGLSQQAKAYDIEACAKNPMTGTPQTINLLQPIDQKMINCIPRLDSISSQWQAKAGSIRSAISGIRIGNQGENDIEKLEYNVVGNTVSLVAKVRAKHTWKKIIPAVTKKVPVDKWRWVEEEVCSPRNPFNGKRKCWTVKEKVPYVEIEVRTITPEQIVSATASTTCKYDYTFNLSTGEQKPIFNCGQGSLGNYKIDLSAITDILNGQTPSLGKLLTTLSLTPPGFRDANRDTYNDVKNGIIANHAGSIVYFSSETFVNWASAEEQGPNIIVAALTGGGYSAELIRQMEERLRTELRFMTVFASQTAINLGAEQIISMMTGNSTLNFGSYNVSVKVVNTPKVIQKCIVNGGDCTPEIKSPRLGFAIIATPTQQQPQQTQSQQTQQTQPQQVVGSCPSSYSPAAFQGRTAKAAFFNEWSVPVTVVLYHSNNRSIFGRYTVSPGQNNFLGDNIVVGDDWGVCFENKPTTSGFVNNLGEISDYISTESLFMIQNPRSK